MNGVFKVDFDTHSSLLKEDNFFHDYHEMFITSLKFKRHHVVDLAAIFQRVFEVKISTLGTRFLAVLAGGIKLVK